MSLKQEHIEQWCSLSWRDQDNPWTRKENGKSRKDEGSFVRQILNVNFVADKYSPPLPPSYYLSHWIHTLVCFFFFVFVTSQVRSCTQMWCTCMAQAGIKRLTNCATSCLNIGTVIWKTLLDKRLYSYSWLLCL